MPSQEESDAGPSGSVSQEGIVVTGGDSAMRVTVPECYLPVGQDVEVRHGDLDDPDPVGLG